ncbi:DUF3365 domain-containing protein [Capnocytophaga sp. ARDL2]|uniref:Tll0287-like domain-containing protein n=1 Tax=Capnocytophaga sp. ARDL2 TaxID=3238809 RepID=UPI00355601FC
MKYISILASSILLFSCKKEDKTLFSTEDIEDIKQHSPIIIKNTFEALSSALVGEISENGVESAVDYCNIHASSFTEMAFVDNNKSYKIYRVSDKNRNPNNTMSEVDLQIFNYYKESMGQIVNDTIVIENDKINYYRPIQINNPLCLQCHGKVGETVTNEVYDKILSKYPKDKAINYQLNDLRGMWKVVSHLENEKK